MRTAKAPAAERGRGARRLDCRVTGAVGNARSRLIDKHTRGLAETEVAAPSEDVRRQLFDHLRQTDPSCPACHVPDLRLEFIEGFWRDAPLAPAIRDAEPQEFAGRATALFASLTFSRSLVEARELGPESVGRLSTRVTTV